MKISINLFINKKGSARRLVKTIESVTSLVCRADIRTVNSCYPKNPILRKPAFLQMTDIWLFDIKKEPLGSFISVQTIFYCFYLKIKAYGILKVLYFFFHFFITIHIMPADCYFYISRVMNFLKVFQ